MAVSSLVYLPDEVIELILSKSPIKSVLRFQSASKSWKFIISDPRFFRTHYIQRSKMPENQNKFFIWSNSQKLPRHLLSLMRLEEGGIAREESEFDLEFRAMSSYNGLFLLWNSKENKDNLYMLWNPSIHKLLMIHAITPETHPHAFKPNTSRRPWWRNFYYDLVADDYKIVLVYDNCYTVYSSKSRNWDVRDFPSDRDLINDSRPFIDGCFYSFSNGEILCFDSRDGKLHKFRKPDEMKNLVGLGVMEGRLCLHGRNDRRFELWVMEEKNGSFENRYTKLTSMEKEGSVHFSFWRRRHVWWRNEDNYVVFRASVEAYEGPEKFIFNPYENSFRKAVCGNSFQEVDFRRKYCVFGFFPYMENLYMPSSN